VIFDPLPYATNLRRENEAELQRTGLRHELALLEARQIALRIKQASPQTRRVILFGSAATGVPRNPRFDLDLALEGGDLYRALDVVAEASIHVDLVDLTLVPPHLRRRIEETGVDLI
jgi:predicted nucleotidyltransferase